MSEETSILQQIRIAVSHIGVRLFRNNVGMYKDERGNYIRYGLIEGSSDLIGWSPTVITQEMVGKTVAVFTAVEVKTQSKKSKASEAQENFISAVLRAGGIAFIARSEWEALGKLRGSIGKKT